MRKVISKDGTQIAYDQSGEGLPIILVVGAFNDHSTGAPLAAQLSEHFTVFNYDRRGRGESGDTAPYAIEREIEDLAALITEAGGSSSVFGYSSGAILSLKAKAAGLALTRLALYDPPFLLDDGFPQRAQEISVRLTELISSGRRGDAVELFQREIVGIPPEIVAQMRHAPFRPELEHIAPTLVYEATLLGDMPVLAQQLPSITVPTLVISGGNNQERMRSAAQTLADAFPMRCIAPCKVRRTISFRLFWLLCWRSSLPARTAGSQARLLGSGYQGRFHTCRAAFIYGGEECTSGLV